MSNSNHQDSALTAYPAIVTLEEEPSPTASHRQFFQTFSADSPGPIAGAYAAGNLAAPEPQNAAEAAKAVSPFAKDATPFIQHGASSLETHLEDMAGFITPVELFFVHNNAPSSLQVDIDSYVLTVEGDQIATPLTLTYKDILNLPSRTLFATVECGGNWRGFFGEVMGQEASGTPWQTGAIGMAEWTGVRLRDVLMIAGVKPNAADVMLIGLDEEAPAGGFRRTIPLDKALDPDTILAYAMNGQPLPPDHGFPLRAIVPGWVGSSSIKWLGKIQVSSETLWSHNNNTSYVLIGDDYPPEGEAEGQAATLQSVKSSLALPRPAELSAGPQMLRGYAHSPYKIIQVEWSDDNGHSWQPATLIDPIMRYAWTRFEFPWNPSPGRYTLMTRATDGAGRTQSKSIPFNEKGYLGNMILPHEVTVT
ncbi:MAG: sulfite oxidase [Anaerolineae bacterium]|nr:sulfite oxidase [Anaerolineae bacterium]